MIQTADRLFRKSSAVSLCGIFYERAGELTGLGDHLFNNVIAANLVHVIAEGEADSLQIVRIIAAQLLSLIIVTIAYNKK